MEAGYGCTSSHGAQVAHKLLRRGSSIHMRPLRILKGQPAPSKRTESCANRAVNHKGRIRTSSCTEERGLHRTSDLDDSLRSLCMLA